MRRRIACGADAGGDQRRMRHRRHRSLAVRSRDVQADEAALGMPERGAQTRDVLEAELDAERFEREQTVEQVSVTEEEQQPQRDAERRPVCLWKESSRATSLGL